MVYVWNVGYIDIMVFNWYVLYDMLRKYVNGEYMLL